MNAQKKTKLDVPEEYSSEQKEQKKQDGDFKAVLLDAQQAILDGQKRLEAKFDVLIEKLELRKKAGKF